MAVTVHKLPEYQPDLLALQNLDEHALTGNGVLCSCVGVWMNDRVEIIGGLQLLATALSVSSATPKLFSSTSRTFHL